MKTKSVFLTAILTAALALPAVGQYDKDSSQTGTGKDTQGMSMGKPTYESTVQGTHLKVWVMSQAERRSMMDSKSMQDSSSMNNNSDNSSMDRDRTSTDKNNSQSGTTNRYGMTGTGGTHHVRVDATDESTGQMVSNMTGTIQVTAPSMKTASVDLQSMMNHYGADVNLTEKGQYQFTLNLTVDGVSKTAQFQYTPAANSSMNMMGQ